MRGYLQLNENKKKYYLDIFFDAYWKDNIDLTLENEISKLLKILKINSELFFKEIKQQSIKDNLKQLTSVAFKKDLCTTWCTKPSKSGSTICIFPALMVSTAC